MLVGHGGNGTVPGVTAQPRRPRTALLVAVPAVAALLLGACGGDDGATAASTTTVPSGSTAGGGSGTSTTAPAGERTDCGVAEGHEVTITAKDLAWDVPCLQAPEGVDLTIVVRNVDDGVNHDLHLKGLPGDPATKLEAGPVTQRLALGSDLRAGTYQYVCDVHPNMTGELQVLAPLAEGPVTTGQ